MTRWWGYSSGWCCKKTSKRPRGLCAGYVGQPGCEQTRPKHGGWLGREEVSRGDIGNGWSSRSTGRTWRRGHWWRTAKPRTEWRKGGWGRSKKRNLGAMILVPTGWRFSRSQDQGPAQLKGVVDGHKHRRKWRCNYETSTSGTLWKYWRRETYPTHSALYVPLWCRRGPWMGCTGAHSSAKGEQRGSDGARRRRRRGRSPPGHSATMGAPCRWWTPSDTYDRWYRTQTTTGRWWSVICPGQGRCGRGRQ